MILSFVLDFNSRYEMEQGGQQAVEKQHKITGENGDDPVAGRQVAIVRPFREAAAPKVLSIHCLASEQLAN